jgi:hypothetical protein
MALNAVMLSVANKPIMLSFVMLSAVMLNVVMLSVVAPCFGVRGSYRPVDQNLALEWFK